jgi:hypothetical protein
VDLGYATTGHRAQGLTRGRALVRLTGTEDVNWTCSSPVTTASSTPPGGRKDTLFNYVPKCSLEVASLARPQLSRTAVKNSDWESISSEKMRIELSSASALWKPWRMAAVEAVAKAFR